MLLKAEVEHIADLAHIELSEQEKEKYLAQLGRVLDYFEKLKEVKTAGVEAADGGTRNLYNIWRADEAQNQDNATSKQADDLIKLAPEKEGRQIKVKSIF